MKKDLSSYFSASRFARWSYKKMMLSAALALVVLGGSLSAAALPVMSYAAGQPTATPQPTAAPTPNQALLGLNWQPDLRPKATATPVPDVEVDMELSGKSQTLEVQLYARVMQEDGTTELEALTGVKAEVVVTCLSLDKLKDESNKYKAQQSVVGAIGKYTLDPDDGSFVLNKLNPGKYKVQISPLEGYAMPAAEEVTVKEKVSYKKVEVQVEQDTGAAGQEDTNPNQSRPAEKPQQGITAVASTAEPIKAGAYVLPLDTAAQATYFWNWNGSLYLYYLDGTRSPYKAVFEKDAAGTQYLVKAEYDAAAASSLAATPVPAGSEAVSGAAATGLSVRRTGLALRTLSSTVTVPEAGASSVPESAATPEPTPEITPTPTPEITPTPTPVSEEATPTPSPTPEDSAQPSPTPEGSVQPSPTPEGSTRPSPTPDSSPTATPTATPTPTVAPTATPAPVASYPFYQDGKPVGDHGFKLPPVGEIVIGYTYTGWQVIDGGQYYYDPATHKPLTGNQIIDGTSYLFNDQGRLSTQVKGIDVSKWNGTKIDWKAVKESGVEFVIIRCGNRGWGKEGSLVEDPTFKANLAGAKAAGLRVGVYFFSQAITEQEAVEEASACLKLLNGTRLDYPVYFDTEFSGNYPNGRADKLSRADRTDIAVAFCETIRSGGYRAGVYASESFFEYHLNFSTLTRNGYSIWNAHYGVAASGIRCDMWQYTGSGSIPGITGAVDINISYIG